ncbi:MAG: hypothetical protein AAFV54_13650, partial [Pseudomonadota bacterium]
FSRPATLALKVADLIDRQAEGDRLKKRIAGLEKDISGIEKKLSNEKFLANAPPEIVEEQHQRKADWGAELAKLSDAFSQLEQL